MSDDPPFEPGSDSAARFPCSKCRAKFMTYRSMKQHERDKHKMPKIDNKEIEVSREIILCLGLWVSEIEPVLFFGPGFSFIGLGYAGRLIVAMGGFGPFYTLGVPRSAR